MELTYEVARAMCIWRWKNFPIGYPDYNDWIESEFKEIYEYYDEEIDFDCGFCHFFRAVNLEDWNSEEDGCKKCHLYWKGAKVEELSVYKKDMEYKCSRNFWHWAFWLDEANKTRMKYWAGKLLAEIEATPEHLE